MPAGHAAAIAKFQRQVFPRNARAQHIDDAVEGLLITDTRSSTFGGRLDLRNQWLDALPQRNRDLVATCHADNVAADSTKFKGFVIGSKLVGA
ncbi:hypothetical protein XAXN_15070 [Xanthomonas axonopodis]|uniref:Uncharacterized protein n=1 Tax=Xanthomonas axonopodis TaxID=53413 RepID=A0A0P6V957_9XANT|nr:hypothetical protein XAXN_15070 [Xanthomonas axonopodis]